MIDINSSLISMKKIKWPFRDAALKIELEKSVFSTSKTLASDW